MRGFLIALLLVLATLAVFGPVCGYDFVPWDDQINVYENPYLNPVTLRGVFRFWREPYRRLYIPLTYSLWAGVAALSGFLPAGAPPAGLNPHVFHSVNLVLHTFNVLLVFAILRLLLRQSLGDDRGAGAASIGALLFALHPIQVQAVAWVTGLKTLLSGLLSLLALWQYLAYAVARARPNGARKARMRYALATAAFVLAMLAKPSAVSMPLVAWVLDTGVVRRSARRSSLDLVVWILLAVPIALLTKRAQPAGIVGFIPPVWGRFLVAGDALAFYLGKLLFPMRIGYDYGRTPEFVLQKGWSHLAWIVPFGLALLLGLHRDRRYWLVSMGVFVAGVLPVLGFVPAVIQFISTVQDHYLYVSMLGPALAFAWFLARRRGARITAAGLLLVGVLGVRSAFQVGTWRDITTLAAHTLKVNSASFFALNDLGVALAKEGRFEEAIARFSGAVRVQSPYAEVHRQEAHNNLGNALASRGRTDEALAHYFEAIRIKPDYVEAHNNLALVFTGLGEFDAAAAHYAEVLRIRPDFAPARRDLRRALLKAGRREEAARLAADQ